MTYYELKKVFVKTSSKAALGALLILLIVFSFFSVNSVNYVNENGETEKGRAAAASLRQEKEQWEGPLTAETVARVIRENSRINQSREARSEDIREQNKAYSKTQGYEDIRLLIDSAFGGFGGFDYNRINSLKAEDAELFYPKRTENLKDWLADENGGAGRFTKEEQQYLLQRYEAMQTPLYYEAADGWDKLFERLPSLLMILVLILGFLVSGIFPCESQLKADSVFYASFHGRRKAVRAKLGAGFLLVTIVYWAAVLIYTAAVLGLLGAGGMNCRIQTAFISWESFYNLTFGQLYLLCVAGGYLGSLFIAFLTMLIGAKTKSAVVSVIVPFVLLLIPMFLTNVTAPVLDQIKPLLPNQLVQINFLVEEFNLYTIGSHVTGPLQILFPLYLVLAALIGPVLYRMFRKAEVK